ncbi:hypothetical protein C7E16_04030 [Acinetobacter radioresistens]|uniref:hypothetical protein n=1 Tax=Acinetobacter radioresistens TaxID=40216 RepID=UPI000D0ADF55|nr:hypothetical protein [Acinetobacter radioresistens]PSD37064.1 hypothetical protein C7E16_04030 [Acinetobacter radioresistens]PSD38755.1 hypothetical protein C7E21_07625 [Acinetobacter radioresistens]
MNTQFVLPELSKYSELSDDEQVHIHQMLISYVRSDHLYNIILTHNVEPYDLVKLVSISFENRDAAIWVHFETITAERLTMPLDFISRIEICNHKKF